MKQDNCHLNCTYRHGDHHPKAADNTNDKAPGEDDHPAPDKAADPDNGHSEAQVKETEVIRARYDQRHSNKK